MRAAVLLCLSLLAGSLLTGCDGEPVNYHDQPSLWDRYDILWQWMSGPSTLNEPGLYATTGGAPGSRRQAAQWKDGSGRLWLFGGEGYDRNGLNAHLNDLWYFDPASAQWTWVGGADTGAAGGQYGLLNGPAASNWPGARSEAITWYQVASDTLWLFGGIGYDGSGHFGRLNDLWRYSGGTWTWLGGSDTADVGGNYGTLGTPGGASSPGARRDAQGWLGSDGALWLFGGSGFDSTGGGCCFLNDLWRYKDGQWTWVAGSELHDPEANYGTLGVADAANTPSGRYGAVVAVDDSGNAWLYGGEGNGTGDLRFVSAELWKYTASGWAWMAGTQATTVSPAHVSRAAPSLSAHPGSRTRMTGWAKDGGLWLFGGELESPYGVVSRPNDLWYFNGLAWTWVGGSSGNNLAGSYRGLGTEGKPGGRSGGAGWTDGAGRLWLFGGDTGDALRNDLWRYP